MTVSKNDDQLNTSINDIPQWKTMTLYSHERQAADYVGVGEVKSCSLLIVIRVLMFSSFVSSSTKRSTRLP